jgi:hypothetical protein
MSHVPLEQAVKVLESTMLTPTHIDLQTVRRYAPRDLGRCIVRRQPGSLLTTSKLRADIE